MSNNQDQDLVLELKHEIKQLLNCQELKDISSWPTEKEIDTLIAVEQGQAFQITIQRDPLPCIRKSNHLFIITIN